MDAEWLALQRAVRILADLYAGIDLRNEAIYRRDVEEFCTRRPPISAVELDGVTAEAEQLIRRWSVRTPDTDVLRSV
jgi:hypothetical protein